MSHFTKKDMNKQYFPFTAIVGQDSMKQALILNAVNPKVGGVLAMANRGILYVDEINLLDDHIVDLLLDSAAMGTNTVEREGISFSHPARFILVGTMNPEEGELRPQLLDRFGLSVEIKGITDPVQRVQIVRLRGEYEENPKEFVERYHEQEHRLCHVIEDGVAMLPKVRISDDILLLNAKLSIAMEVDGHRSDLTLMKTERTMAAIRGKTEVTREEVRDSARMVFLHRTRMLPFETSRKLDMDKINAIIDGE